MGGRGWIFVFLFAFTIACSGEDAAIDAELPDATTVLSDLTEREIAAICARVKPEHDIECDGQTHTLAGPDDCM